MQVTDWSAVDGINILFSLFSSSTFNLPPFRKESCAQEEGGKQKEMGKGQAGITVILTLTKAYTIL